MQQKELEKKKQEFENVQTAMEEVRQVLERLHSLEACTSLVQTFAQAGIAKMAITFSN